MGKSLHDGPWITRDRSRYFLSPLQKTVKRTKIGVIANNDNQKAFFSCWNTGFFSFFVGSEFHMNNSTWRIAPCRKTPSRRFRNVRWEMVMTLITEIVINSPFAHSRLPFITLYCYKKPGDRHRAIAPEAQIGERCGKAVVSIGKTRMSDGNVDTTGKAINSRLLTDSKAALRSHHSD